MMFRLYFLGLITFLVILIVSSVHAGPLHNAAVNGDIAQAKRLIAQGADVNDRISDGTTPLHWVAWGGAMSTRRGHKAVAELLIAHGADVNAKDMVDSTPLHFASFNGRTAIAKLLIAHGANINAKRNDGATPLNVAKTQRHNDIVYLLKQHGGVEDPSFNNSERLPTAKELF